MAWGSQGGEPLAEGCGLTETCLDLSGGDLSDDVAHRGFKGMEEVLGFLFGPIGSGAPRDGVHWRGIIGTLSMFIGYEEFKPG